MMSTLMLFIIERGNLGVFGDNSGSLIGLVDSGASSPATAIEGASSSSFFGFATFTSVF